MFKKISKHLLSLEIGFLLIPITLFYAVGCYVISIATIFNPTLANFAVAIVTIICAMAIYSLWVLSYIVLFVDSYNKNGLNWYLVFIIVGTFIGMSSLISNMIPLVGDNSNMYHFRHDFSIFVLGLPLVVVGLHLYYEINKC